MDAASLPDDIATLRAALTEAQARACAAEALITSLKLEIAKLRRELYGPRAERTARLLAQLELQLEDLEATASEDDLAAEQAAAKTTTVRAFTRNRPARQPFPAHLPRERVVVAAPTQCPCCGSDKLRKLGETITETLEVIPRQWKVIRKHPASAAVRRPFSALGRLSSSTAEARAAGFEADRLFWRAHRRARPEDRPRSSWP
jgi:transposase